MDDLEKKIELQNQMDFGTKILQLTNEFRMQNKLPALVWS